MKFIYLIQARITMGTRRQNLRSIFASEIVQCCFSPFLQGTLPRFETTILRHFRDLGTVFDTAQFRDLSLSLGREGENAFGPLKDADGLVFAHGNALPEWSDVGEPSSNSDLFCDLPKWKRGGRDPSPSWKLSHISKIAGRALMALEIPAWNGFLLCVFELLLLLG